MRVAPGEYAPEALACMDDEGQSVNPDYLASKKAEAGKEPNPLKGMGIRFSAECLALPG